MSHHFTYQKPADKDNLTQGDILKKTEEICRVLEQFHPHYLKDDYHYFLVLTQSCDLVRRNGRECNAKYISIAAIRPFDTVLNRELQKYQKEAFERIVGSCSLQYRTNLCQFVERILNNNHPEYFYLHEDNTLDFAESYCAFLRLSIAIRASDHYEKCLDARFIELTDEFRAKLGWLVGHLYSRVGTTDWAPDVVSENEFKGLIRDTLDKKAVWMEKDIVKAVKRHLTENNLNEKDMSYEEFFQIIEQIHLPTKMEKKKRVLEGIKTILEKPNILNEGISSEKIIARIDQDTVFSSHFK